MVAGLGGFFGKKPRETNLAGNFKNHLTEITPDYGEFNKNI